LISNIVSDYVVVVFPCSRELALELRILLFNPPRRSGSAEYDWLGRLAEVCGDAGEELLCHRRKVCALGAAVWANNSVPSENAG